MTTSAIITLNNIAEPISVRIAIDGGVTTILSDLATLYSGRVRTEQALKWAYFRNFARIVEKDPRYIDRVVWDTDTRYVEADWVYEVDRRGVLSIKCMDEFHPASKREFAHPYDYLTSFRPGCVGDGHDAITRSIAQLEVNGVTLKDIAPCPKLARLWGETLKQDKASAA